MGGDSETRAGGPQGTADAGPDAQEVSSRVVIAGAEADRRAALLDRLTQRLPEETVFLEADTVPRTLEHARGSRMVVIVGPLREAEPSALAEILARRLPGVHVVDLSARR